MISNSEHGNTIESRPFLNYITIEHGDGEFSQYCHLAKDSLFEGLIEGMDVPVGAQLAVTGMTGWTDRPHLHFVVGRWESKQIIEGQEISNPQGFKSLKPKFEVRDRS